MATVDKLPMLAEGYEKLQADVRHLKTVERPAVIDAIEEARGHGDLSENAEYHAAKERQGHVEAQIADIEDRLSRAMVIDPSTLSGNRVVFGATVTSEGRERQEDQISDRRRDRGRRQDRPDQLFLAARPRPDRPHQGRGGRVLGAVGRQILRDRQDRVQIGRLAVQLSTKLGPRPSHPGADDRHDGGLGRPLDGQPERSRPLIGAASCPARVSGLVDDAGSAPVWLTPLIATFIHANIIHLGFNLLILVFCGRPTEAVLGPVGFGLLYLLGAYAAAAVHYLIDPTAIGPMIGASGAISAVLGAYAILFGRNKVKVASPALAMWLNALWLMAAWVVLQLAVVYTFAGLGAAQIAIGAHIGGFLVGVAARQSAAAAEVPESLAASRSGQRRAFAFQLRLEQAVEVDDDIFHLGVVDGALGAAAPGVERAGIIGIEADQVDRVEVEVEAARILDPAAEHQMELAHRAASVLAAADRLHRPLRRPSGRLGCESPRPAPCRRRGRAGPLRAPRR